MIGNSNERYYSCSSLSIPRSICRLLVCRLGIRRRTRVAYCRVTMTTTVEDYSLRDVPNVDLLIEEWAMMEWDKEWWDNFDDNWDEDFEE